MSYSIRDFYKIKPPFLCCEGLAKLLDPAVHTTKDFKLIDVRYELETHLGRICTDQIHISLHELNRALDLNDTKFEEEYEFNPLLYRDNQSFLNLPDKTLIFYCRTQRRSKMSAAYAWQKGFRAIYLQGGITEWALQKRPCYLPCGSQATFVGTRDEIIDELKL